MRCVDHLQCFLFTFCLEGTEEEEEAEEGLDDLLGGALDDSESDGDGDEDDDGDDHRALPGDESEEEIEFSDDEDGDEDDGSAADWAGWVLHRIVLRHCPCFCCFCC